MIEARMLLCIVLSIWFFCDPNLTDRGLMVDMFGFFVISTAWVTLLVTMLDNWLLPSERG